MPPSIHPVDLISALRQKHLTPAIVFLTSRRACDEAMEAFDHANCVLPTTRQRQLRRHSSRSWLATLALPSTH